MLGKYTSCDLDTMEYCYCCSCLSIKESSDLVLGASGKLQCRQCGSLNLDAPGWVFCPHQKLTAVKCPRAGRGISIGESGLECTDRCSFRA